MKVKRKFQNKIEVVNYKNIRILKKYINIGGKIHPKFVTILCPKTQRKVSKSIKTSRILGLLKFVSN